MRSHGCPHPHRFPRVIGGLVAVAALAAAVIPAAGPAAGAAPAVATRHQAPTISQLVASTRSLPTAGGPVVFKARVRRARRCRLSATPRVQGLPMMVGCRRGRVNRTVRIPANPTTARVTYVLSLRARARHQPAVTRQLAVSVSPTPPCPGQTSVAPPTTTAFFNDPVTGASRDRDAVVAAMVNLICDVSKPVDGKPSVIDLAELRFSLPVVSQALLWAHDYRQAVVRVALDGANAYVRNPVTGAPMPNPAYTSLKAGLPRGSIVLCGPKAGLDVAPPLDEPSDTGRGGTSCAGDNILHTKLMLVSSVDAARDSAVFLTSQNFDSTAENQAYNNGVQLVGDNRVYAGDVAYVNRLLSNTRQPDLGDRIPATPQTTNRVTAVNYFFPRNITGQFPVGGYDAAADQPADLVAQTLSKVSCANPGANAGTIGTSFSPVTVVHVAMFDYKHRGQITDQLTNLAAQGCDVQIVYAQMGSGVMSVLTAAGINPVQLSSSAMAYTGGGGGSGRIFVHDKYVLVSGALADGPNGAVQPNQNLVITGSQNWTENGLHDNDEAVAAVMQTATGIGSTPVYAAYAANWLRLRQLAAANTAVPVTTP